jgi:hypothetical protein
MSVRFANIVAHKQIAGKVLFSSIWLQLIQGAGGNAIKTQDR